MIAEYGQAPPASPSKAPFVIPVLAFLAGGLVLISFMWKLDRKR